MPGTEMRGVAAEDCSEREARRLRFTFTVDGDQRHTDTETHGYRDIYGYRDIHGYRDTELQRYNIIRKTI